MSVSTNDMRWCEHYGYAPPVMRILHRKGLPETSCIFSLPSGMLSELASNVSRWMQMHRKETQEVDESGTTMRELQAEVRRLKKENHRLEMEREILEYITFYNADRRLHSTFGLRKPYEL